ADAKPEDFTLKTMPDRYARIGDVASGMDSAAGSLEALLALAERHESEGLGDAPWPPHYEKMPGEPDRVQPSRKKKASPKPKREPQPLLVISKAAALEDAMAGLERWKERHPIAAQHLEVGDVLVDSMRGRSTTWTRIRVNLRHVPEVERPPEEPPD